MGLAVQTVAKGLGRRGKRVTWQKERIIWWQWGSRATSRNITEDARWLTSLAPWQTGWLPPDPLPSLCIFAFPSFCSCETDFWDVGASDSALPGVTLYNPPSWPLIWVSFLMCCLHPRPQGSPSPQCITGSSPTRCFSELWEGLEPTSTVRSHWIWACDHSCPQLPVDRVIHTELVHLLLGTP